MNNFKKGGFRQGGGGFGRRSSKFRGGNDRPGGHKELFPAICSECQKKCEVPFRPTGEKPVYCRECFDKQRGHNSGGDFRPQREYQSEQPKTLSDSGINDIKQRLLALESKVSRILELVSQKPETPAAKTVKAKKEKTSAKKTTKKSKK